MEDKELYQHILGLKTPWSVGEVKGNPGQRRGRGELRRWLIRMEFATYLNSLMLILGQVIRSARTLKVRLLTYRPSVEKFLTLHDHIGFPLRH